MSLNTGNAILSNGITLDSSYNVGIGGAASGSYKLQVTGTTNLTGALTGAGATFSGLDITSASASPVGLTITGGDETFVKFIGPSGVKNWGFITTNLAGSDFGIYQSTSAGGDPFSAGTPKLYFNGDGAATFSSSVNINASPSSDRMFQVSGTAFTSGSTQFGMVLNPTWSGTITNVYGIYTGNNFGTGTITNSYNLYIESTSAGSATITNRFGLYQAGSSDKNYFAGNVGIGTSSPGAKLEVNGQINALNGAINFGGTGTPGSTDPAIYRVGSGINDMGFAIGSTERMRITSGGQVNIGNNDSGALRYYNSAGTYIGGLGTTYWAFGGGYSTTDLGMIAYNNLVFGVNSGEKMRITSGGFVEINRTSDLGNGYLEVNGSASRSAIACNQTSTSTSYQIYFSNPNGIVGSISTNGTSTAFNTSSDYRLKQDFKDYNGLNLVSAIKTYDYEWKSDNKRAFGVIAHELAEVLPYAVVGEKDGEQMQQVDYSKIVPVLVKAIQELNQTIQNQQQQINSLINR